MKHVMQSTIVSVIFVTMGCSGNELYLEKRPGYNPESGVLRTCLNMAYEEINAGKSTLTADEENALGGRDVTKFLWWGSLAGPRPVVNTAGKPSEASSLVTYPSTNSVVSKRYVLCLLRNGYQWPPNQN